MTFNFDSISFVNLEMLIKQFLANEDRKDKPFRFCLLQSQFGDLFHYLTHDKVLNPNARVLGSRNDEKLICGQALMQLLISFDVVGVSVSHIFVCALNKLNISDVRIGSRVTVLLQQLKIKQNQPQIIDRLLKISHHIDGFISASKKLERARGGGKTRHRDLIRSASIQILSNLLMYIAERDFSVVEILKIGLINQSERDWAEKIAQFRADNKIVGIIGNPGIISGEAYVVSSNCPLSGFTSDKILVIDSLRADHFMTIGKPFAIVTDNGGKISHPANIARELGIICLVGTGNATKVIKSGDKIIVHAEKFDGSSDGQGYVEII